MQFYAAAPPGTPLSGLSPLTPGQLFGSAARPSPAPPVPPPAPTGVVELSDAAVRRANDLVTAAVREWVTATLPALGWFEVGRATATMMAHPDAQHAVRIVLAVTHATGGCAPDAVRGIVAQVGFPTRAAMVAAALDYA